MATAESSAAGRSLVYQRWAKYPSDEARRAQMAPLWAGRDRRFYVQACEMHPLASERDIARCAESLRRSWYADFSRRGHAAKAAKKAGKTGTVGRAA